MIFNEDRLKNAKPIHPLEPKRVYLYNIAYEKEQKRKERENLLRDVLNLFILLKNNHNEQEIENFIVGDKIDLFEYNKQLEKEVGIK